ncbi:hypothetical protein [Microbacterium sp. 77mftsu3.1]|uniref:hypothetical protein n=1 Tax=Microbacterium sp. 77mftsu3.1 TaxID=1761802 RepID=UPI000371E430|nr:hypothetical protein [Microbacterium sp. 77mftsu3.1]SDH53382.1 hypothetical protein SAMN04488590_3500 [Microbacterium sp. 77mftsu3.1]
MPDTNPNFDDIVLTPTIIDESGNLFVHTRVDGIELDRRDMVGYGVSTTRNALRLAAAVRAGAVFHDFQVLTDRNGKTYLSASSRVYSRTMNADLKRLGY